MLSVALAAALSPALLCCDGYTQGWRSRVIRLPTPPECWTAILGPPSWELRWVGPSGEPERLVLAAGETRAAAELPRSGVAWVQALPAWPSAGIPAGKALPAGAIYPYGLDGDTLVLGWAGGVSAKIFEALESRGAALIARRFDWPRFEELVELGGTDPWSAPLSVLVAELSAGRFDSRRLRPPTEPVYSVVLPDSGPWVSASPFAGAWGLPEPIIGNPGPVDLVLPDPDRSMIDAAALLCGRGYLKLARSGSGFFSACVSSPP